MRAFLRSVDREFTRYCVVGASGVVVDLVVLGILHQGAGIPLLAANVVSFLVAVQSNYLLNAYWTFNARPRRPHFTGGPMFLLAALVGLGVNELGLWVLSAYVEVFYVWAKLALVGVVLAWNYTYNNAITFARRPAEGALSRSVEVP